MNRKDLRFALEHLHPGATSLSIIRPIDDDLHADTPSHRQATDHGHVELVVGRIPITKELAGLIPEVTSLRIQNVYIDRDAMGTLASRLGIVEELCLEHTGVFDDGATAIAGGLTHGLLRTLRVPGNKLASLVSG